ncbi:hypothetical protein TCDM_06335 [Trypanosoma cruzi Dm28c]|uniref:Uncharacterized protein n=1 Tax=Trypanosoma cruzi Dm28c TaxID=1416333 RepID=V5AWT0_TRYCR|nr:hypothetical protein TCDM_06335 [Trypanosoma cruzi Dm28c]
MRRVAFYYHTYLCFCLFFFILFYFIFSNIFFLFIFILFSFFSCFFFSFFFCFFFFVPSSPFLPPLPFVGSCAHSPRPSNAAPPPRGAGATALTMYENKNTGGAACRAGRVCVCGFMGG